MKIDTYQIINIGFQKGHAEETVEIQKGQDPILYKNKLRVQSMQYIIHCYLCQEKIKVSR